MRKLLHTTPLNKCLKHLWLWNADIPTTPALGCNYSHLVNMYFLLWVYNQSVTTGLSCLYLLFEFSHFMHEFLDLYVDYFGVRIVIWNNFHEVLFKVQSLKDWLQSIHFLFFSQFCTMNLLFLLFLFYNCQNRRSIFNILLGSFHINLKTTVNKFYEKKIGLQLKGNKLIDKRFLSCVHI